MADEKPVLIIDPSNEMKFKGSFNAESISCTLNIFNPTDKKIAYKVKTTAPRRYCVRPNSGVIEPRQRVNVLIMLQSFDLNPEEKAKHKFMVQSMFLEGPYDVDTIWKNAPAEKVVDAKLRCVFELGEEDAQPAAVPTLASKTASEESASKTEVQEPKHEHSKLQQEMAELKREISTLRTENLELKKSRPISTAEGDSVHYRSTPECVSNPVLQELKKQEELLFRTDKNCAFTSLHVLLSIFLAFLAGIIVTKFFSSTPHCT